MPTFHHRSESAADPQQVIAGLTDFGPARSTVFPTSAPGAYQVHGRGPGWADVTEGSQGVWERLRYEWDDTTITARTTRSNAWGGASGHTWVVTPRPGGGSVVEVTVVRDPGTTRGRLLSPLLRLLGPRIIRQGTETSLRAVERMSGS